MIIQMRHRIRFVAARLFLIGTVSGCVRHATMFQPV